jgi:adenylate cyclase
MGIEIERKFLVDHDQWEPLARPEGVILKQGYLIADANKTIRVRTTGKQAYITFKGAASGISRAEYEYEIPVQDGTELLEQFAKSIINKTRYCISFANKVWEVDVFEGDNEGLIVAEIELEAEDELIELPPWVTQEVTNREEYYNSSLSVHPFKSW